MHSHWSILNPKRQNNKIKGRLSWFPYYAGFSVDFASSLFLSGRLPRHSHILDPWNGSGTTSYAAAMSGLSATGFDLNPVMVIAAKALAVGPVKGSLLSLAKEVYRKTGKAQLVHDSRGVDPLHTWFLPSSVEVFRSIEGSIRSLLIDTPDYQYACQWDSIECLSALSAFFYVAYFRTIRSFLKPFQTSNPTWIKSPKNSNNKLSPTKQCIIECFAHHIQEMNSSYIVDHTPTGVMTLDVASSLKIPLPDKHVDMILSSPPYCTRIDYAIATKPELAALGYSDTNGFTKLRHELMGTTTVPREAPPISTEWGSTCLQLVEKINSHGSKASNTYYMKSHLQYFDSLYKSVQECGRVIKNNASAFFVVQDSYYKDELNDLPEIFSEMARNCGFQRISKKPFNMPNTMANVNQRTRKYRNASQAHECVLHFMK